MTTIYHIQTTKPRSETGARPELVFFAWFVVEETQHGGRKAELFLSQAKHPQNRYIDSRYPNVPEKVLFKHCVEMALTTYGTEPCAAIRKKIARLGEVCNQEAPDLPTLLDNAGFSFSVLEL